MLSLDDRAALVLAEAWRLLPPLKHHAPLVAIELADLGAGNGSYTPATGVIRLHPRLFMGATPAMLPCIDYLGNDPPYVYPLCSRGLHTAIHELGHAVGAGTDLDRHPDWFRLGGWVEMPDDPPGTGRYWERRPGWPAGPSSWRYARGTWFGRDYASQSPFEYFADVVAVLCLDWGSLYGPLAQPALTWVRRHVFGETSTRVIEGATSRWRTCLDAHIDASLSPIQRTTRVRTIAEKALTRAVSSVLDRWLQTWRATWADLVAETGGGWPSLPSLAQDLLSAVQPSLTRLWQQLTGQSLAVPRVVSVPAAVTFAQRTLDRLRALVTPALRHGRQAVATALHAVHTEALTTRLPLLVQSMTRHALQAAARTTALLQGATHATWHTTSGNPCDWCAALEGQTFPLTDAPLWTQGEEIRSTRGKGMALDYEDIYHPPLHIHCRCELLYTTEE